MGIQSKTHTIEGEDFVITQFGGTKNLDALEALISCIAPIVAQSIPANASQSDILNTEIDIKGLIASLVFSLENKKVRNLIHVMLERVAINGRQLNNDAAINDYFIGDKIFILPELIFCVVETNWGNLSAAKATFARLADRVRSLQSIAS